jgi:hypothetical protein
MAQVMTAVLVLQSLFALRIVSASRGYRLAMRTDGTD